MAVITLRRVDWRSRVWSQVHDLDISLIPTGLKWNV